MNASQPRTLVATDPVDLRRLLSEAGLPDTGPVIVLIGGAAKLTHNQSGALAAIVRDGVVATAAATGATVVDGGTDAGVMALAGQARRELGTDVSLVGVAPIGRVTAAGVDGATGATALEPNHSLVVLAPGDEWGDESPWLVDVARTLSAGRPVVAVVVDGGQVAGVEATKCRAEGWPVITLAGSGRTADDLARIARRAPGAQDGGGLYVSDVADGAAALASMLRGLLEGRSPGTTPTPAIDKIEYPTLYVAVSEASKRGQRRYKLLSAGDLLLTLLALTVAVLSTFWPVEHLSMEAIERNALVVFMAGSFFVAFALKLVTRALAYDEDWHTGRAVAEGVKSQAWRYMTRVAPYQTDEADDQFVAELGGLMRRASDIRQAMDRVGPQPQSISASMRAARALDLTGRRELYARLRLLDQATWYARRSARHQRAAGRWFWLSLVFQLLAAISAFLAVHLASHATSALDLGDLFLRMMSGFAAVAIAIAAWTQLNRDEELGRSYGLAFQELTLIAGAAERASSEAGLETVVRDGEEAISRENRAWMAKRAERYESPDFTISS